jgi:DNA-binding phage protein
MTGAEWIDTKQKFSRIAARRGIRNVASEVPVDRATIYRIIRGETVEPHQATKAGIERIVEKHEQENKP